MATKVTVATYLLIVVNILVFLIGLSNPDCYASSIYDYGLIPVHVLQGKNLFTLVTSMFLHADFLHLGVNMLFLLIAGGGCERAMGSSRFLVFYLACGVFSGLFHTYLNIAGNIPAIGASGAIFGVLAAFAILFPFRWLVSLFGMIPVPVPAIIFVFITVLVETAYVASGVVENIAHTAHIGGFLAGVFLTLLFGPRKHEEDEH